MNDSQLTANRQAQKAALQAVAEYEPETTALLRYVSRGDVLVIGDASAIEVAPRLSEAGLKVQVLMTEGDDEPGLPAVPLGGRALRLAGWLGEFVVELGEQGKANYEKIKADLVLDLSPKAINDAPLPPPGYLCADPNDEHTIASALLELVALRGTFEKPKFFDYDADICAHKNNGVEGCRRCIDVCPANAISSIQEQIEVTPSLCQGGGVCATVCPTGAIRYAYPRREDSLKRVSSMLGVYAAAGGVEPVLAIIADGDFTTADGLADNVLPLVVEEIGSVGLDVWLMALVMGARRIEVHRGRLDIPRVLNAITEQVSVVDVLLEALGFPSGVVGLYKSGGGDQLMPNISMVAVPALSNKRQYAYFAVDHLYRQSTAAAEIVDLPQGAPFGTLSVNQDACTLCLACTTVCPAQAVRAGGDAPRLLMHESECVQCGMCAKACPEEAITLVPRIIADAEQRRRSVVLHEEEPFCCISCGKPFGSRAAVTNIISKLSGHSMFQTERSLERLKMCDDCRVVDIVQDEEMMGVSELH